MQDIEINNNVKISELYNNKTWIHGLSNNNINITIFLITINSDQLKYALESINNLDTKYSVLINIIMNISPTNKAYNEMRIRCKTKYFIQNDEDMELNPDALDIIYNELKNNNDNDIFLHQFKLIDDILGLGNPPIIDCLKLYNNDIMIKYPTYHNGDKITSSVDFLWHKNILEDNFKTNPTQIIIGHHGKHRNSFDLMLRHCKSIKSILDPNIKTRNSHLCKILRILYNDNININKYFDIIIQHFNLFSNIHPKKLDSVIKVLNSYIPEKQLEMYNIVNRKEIIYNFNNSFDFNIFFELFTNKNLNLNKLFCIIGIICVITNNYDYSYDKYPYDIYNYFNNIFLKKKIDIIENINDLKYDFSFIISDVENIKYDKNNKIFYINKVLLDKCMKLLKKK